MPPFNNSIVSVRFVRFVLVEVNGNPVKLRAFLPWWFNYYKRMIVSVIIEIPGLIFFALTVLHLWRQTKMFDQHTVHQKGCIDDHAHEYWQSYIHLLHCIRYPICFKKSIFCFCFLHCYTCHSVSI